MQDLQVQSQSELASSFPSDLMAWLGAGWVLGDVSAMDERDYEAVYTLGHNFYAQGKFPEAMRIFSYLVMNNHLERRFINAFASSLQMVGGYKDAIKYYGVAFVMDSSDSAPTFHSCECLIALGRKEEAKAGLSAIINHRTLPGQAEIRARSQALLALLNRPQAH
jgi:type III secretion system low calcium response chaperone LcrH/SycD